MAGGWLANRYGRRSILRVSGVLFLASAIFAAVPHTIGEFLLARLLGGLGIGLASTIAPVYLAEVSPREKRGSIVTLNQMAIVTGILMAYCTNWAFSLTGAAAWRWMFGSAALPAFAFIVCLRFVPESPRWLVQERRGEKASAALHAIGGDAHESETMREIVKAIAEEEPPPGWLRRMRRPLLLAVVVAALQQMTGINTVLYYGSMLFVAHGNSGSDSRAFAANVLIGLTNFVFTLVALAVMDRIGGVSCSAGRCWQCLVRCCCWFSISSDDAAFFADRRQRHALCGGICDGVGTGCVGLHRQIFPPTFAGAPCGLRLQCCGPVAFSSRILS